ncbi:MAG: acetylornithine deacetylase/succinyl-diaminopimelate desuccinylase-like protein [Verrucomicrobiales bacterium]|jgi:acetylornithine deacetylase/succinyl-diaminopimelate desuccinylase-like protein
MFSLEGAAFSEAKSILQDLLRIDTTNPPGNERPAIEYVQQLLEAEGFDCTIVESAPGRANLVTRLKGNGEKEPLLLNAHLDVVPARAEDWTHPPFSGIETDGCIWGRGAIDMKGFAVMAMTVLRLLKTNGVALNRDVIFAAVADEEAGCEFGSAYLAEHHPNLIKAEHVINEVGGFTVDVRGKRMFMVQVAERGIAWLRIRVRGVPGHGACPNPESAAAKAGRIVERLAKSRLPHHLSSSSRRFLKSLAKHSPFLDRIGLTLLQNRLLSPWVLHHLVPAGTHRQVLQANLSNTVNPNIISSGSKINVTPEEVVIDVDGRVVPGSSTEELISEIRALIGDEPEIEILRDEPPVEFEPDAFYEQIEAVLNERCPGDPVIPYPVIGFTDSRNYAKLGAKCFGFYPLTLPPEMDFARMFHGIDERIPVDGFRFGIEALYDLVTRVSTRSDAKDS